MTSEADGREEAFEAGAGGEEVAEPDLLDEAAMVDSLVLDVFDLGPESVLSAAVLVVKVSRRLGGDSRSTPETSRPDLAVREERCWLL